MFPEFRRSFPRAALISELLQIDHGKYIVLVRVESEGRIWATGLAAADTIETAEDRARERAIAVLTTESIEPVISPPIPPIVPSMPEAIAPVAETAPPPEERTRKRNPPRDGNSTGTPASGHAPSSGNPDPGTDTGRNSEKSDQNVEKYPRSPSRTAAGRHDARTGTGTRTFRARDGGGQLQLISR